MIKDGASATIALERLGSGTTTLTGVNTYTGLTTVGAGTLAVNGTLAGAVNVSSGGTLIGVGSVSAPVTVSGTLSAGNSPGTLTLGELTLMNGSTSLFELNAPGVVGGTNDLVRVTTALGSGNLSLDGTLQLNGTASGYYRLFEYGGTLAGSFDAVSGGGGLTPTVLTNIGGQVNLSLLGAGQQIQFWDGNDRAGNGVIEGGDGIWDAGNTNWTGMPGQAGINDEFRGSVGTFSGVAGIVTVEGTRAFDALQFSTDGYVLDGGTLAIGPGATPGTLNIDGAVTTTINSVIANGVNMSLTKAGGGTLVLTGVNTYTGTTTISAGTLQIGDAGTSGSIVGDVANAGTLAFNRLDTYSYGGMITGTGRFEQVGTGTMNLTGNSGAFTGQTAVSGGTLRVNGTLGGTLSVANDAVLGGSGTVGATTINGGGVIAPGNSIDTLTVDGDLTLKAGSVYQVEVDPTGTTSDLIVVNGTAFLAGSVMHIGEDGNYKPLSDYKILTASGGFAGTTFDGVSSAFSFLDALLDYGATDVTLRLERNDVAFASVAGTANQKSVAGGLDSLSFGKPVYNALAVLDGPNARQAFDQLSGELHGSGITALIGNSGKLRSMVSRRFQSVFANGRAATSFPLTSYASWGSAAEQASATGYSAWGQVFGSWGRTSGDGNAATLRHDDGGFLLWADAILAETWSLGAFAGYSRSTFSASDRASSGSSDNFHLGFHAGTEIGALRLNVGAAQTWHALDTRRSVAFPGLSDSLSASYSARTAQIFGEAGYLFDMGITSLGGLAFEPFAGLAYVHTTTDGFTERGGAAALTAARSTTATTFSTLGLRAFSQFEVGGMRATVRGMVGWRHAFGDTAPTTRLNFASGTGFSVFGTPIAKDTALVEAGLDLAIRENVSFGLSYDGQYSGRSQEHGFNAHLKVAF